MPLIRQKTRPASSSWKSSCLVFGSFVALACQEAPPTRVQLEPLELLTSSESVKSLVWLWDDSNQKKVGSGKYDYRVEPTALASVDPSGQVSCSSSGDGTLTVTVQGVSADVPLRCRLVDRIETPALGRIDIADGPVALEVFTVAKDGQRFSDVPISLVSHNPKVARSMGPNLEPLEIGRARIQARAGALTRTFEVDVVRRLKPEALPINGGTQIHFSLEPGRYELIVELESAKKLSMDWRSAPYCNTSATAKVHQAVCLLRIKGGVVFNSPNYLNSGSKEVSHEGITLHEVPQL